jgi:hypothetical protein
MAAFGMSPERSADEMKPRSMIQIDKSAGTVPAPPLFN